LELDDLDFVPPFNGEQESILDYSKDQNELIFPKKRKIETEFIVPQSPISSYFSAPFDYLLNHLLSYDQILEPLCQAITSLLIFGRNYWRKCDLVDPSTALFIMKQKCSIITIDFREFPSRLLSSFLHWVYETAFKTNSFSLPTVYCLVCGCPDNGFHDIKIHTEFYNSLDSSLVEQWKAKAHNLFDFLKELISFLLRHPYYSITEFIETWLHCPFCSLKGGAHCSEKHTEWRTKLQIDLPSEMPKEPEPLDVKSGFDFLMDQVGYQIPSFVWSLHNVQNLLDCLVAIWKSMRLIS